MFGGSATVGPQAITLGGPTVAPLRAVNPAIPQVTMPTAAPTAALVNGTMQCWAIADFQTREGTVPAEAQVRVFGYTKAKGGMVLAGTDWVSVSVIRCDGDLNQLERPYIVPGTPTREPRAAAPVVAPPVVIVQTAVPAPVVQPTPVNGLWTSGFNCWTINVEGVSQIWVNGKGVGVGTYCGVTDLHIVVGGVP